MLGKVFILGPAESLLVGVVLIGILGLIAATYVARSLYKNRRR
jgi:hypothetical protein